MLKVLKHALTLPLLLEGLLLLGLKNRLRFNNLVFFTLEELLDDEITIIVLFDCEANSLIDVMVAIGISISSSSGGSLSALVAARVGGVFILVFFTIICLLTIIILLGGSLLGGNWRLRHKHLSHSKCVHDKVTSSLVEIGSNHVDDDNNLFFDDLFLFLGGLLVI